MTVKSWDSSGTDILGELTYEVSSLSVMGGDYKVPYLADITADVSSIPIESGQQIYTQWSVARIRFTCGGVLSNISASKLCLHPMTIGSYCFASFGYNKNPGYINYLTQELPTTISHLAIDALGSYLGNAAFPYGFSNAPINGLIADTLYLRLDGGIPEACSLDVQYYNRRIIVPTGSYNKTTFSYVDI